MILSVHERVFRLTDGLTDCCGVLDLDNFLELSLQCFWLFVHQHWPLFSFMCLITYPITSLFSSFIVIVFSQLFFD
jgi:hypothetical protein